MPDQEYPVRLDNICKSIGDQNILSDISFIVPNNAIFGLVGLNGAGKTTIIKSILNLVTIDSGECQIYGLNCNDHRARSRLVYLPEKFAPAKFLTGKEFLSLLLSYYGVEYESSKAEFLAKRLDLNPKILTTSIASYSKGMGQKLGLISVFMSNCSLMILDEPMSGLDAKARVLLKTLLKEYQSQGHTIILSSHILSDIDEICDEIAVIHSGTMMFNNTPQELKKHTKENDLEKAFIKFTEYEDIHDK